tara:strand:- start:910 stop:1032 length:123 start_codon:yes stop_codon:yes gene_type:complete
MHQRTIKARLLKGMCNHATLTDETNPEMQEMEFLLFVFIW